MLIPIVILTFLVVGVLAYVYVRGKSEPKSKEEADGFVNEARTIRRASDDPPQEPRA